MLNLVLSVPQFSSITIMRKNHQDMRDRLHANVIFKESIHTNSKFTDFIRKLIIL